MRNLHETDKAIHFLKQAVLLLVHRGLAPTLDVTEFHCFTDRMWLCLVSFNCVCHTCSCSCALQLQCKIHACGRKMLCIVGVKTKETTGVCQ